MRFHNLDLNLLALLDRLITERSVSATAQQLRMTQPAVSNALARLRLHFRDDLMVQVGRRMEPTAFALSLQDRIRDALHQLEAIANAQASFDPTTAERTFILLASDYVFLVFVTKAIRRLAEVAPGLRLRAMLTTEHSEDLLRKGEVDFMILPEQLAIAEHPTAPLFTDHFTCIAWSGNTELGEELTLEDYLAAGHVSTSLGPTNVSHIEQEALDSMGVTRRIAAYAPNFTLAADTVVGTPYIATIHSRSARLLAERLPIKLYEPPLAIPAFTETIQWHRSRTTDQAAAWMRSFLCECAAEMGD
jgi:LysR family transcriptional regulator, nod-box dependent transcriptional activator